ncbi:MAG: hypothetical protein IPO98_06920 [Saprospiraceae bacterium]|nr:hypothetical protein [Saprospiraceae bacterium]
MSIKKLISGFSSGAVGTATTLIIQLLGIPTLLTYWGKSYMENMVSLIYSSCLHSNVRYWIRNSRLYRD